MKQVKLEPLQIITPRNVTPQAYSYATRYKNSRGEYEYKGLLVQEDYCKGVYKNRMLTSSFTMGNMNNLGPKCSSLEETITGLLERGWEVMECATLAEVAEWLEV